MSKAPPKPRFASHQPTSEKPLSRAPGEGVGVPEFSEGRSTPRLFWLGLALLLTFAAIALLAPLLAPHDPRLPSGRPLAPPTADHLLGTNDLGQDVLSQLIYGARASLLVATVVTLISTLLSWLVGLLAGFSRILEPPLMVLTDLLLALPACRSTSCC